MPGKQSGKGKKSQRRNGGKKGRQHNVGGSTPPEDVPASAGGKASPFPADDNADLHGEIVDAVPSQEDNADEGTSNGPVPAQRRRFRGPNVLPQLFQEVQDEHAVQGDDDGLPDNMSGRIIRGGEKMVEDVRKGVNLSTPKDNLSPFIALLEKFLEDNTQRKAPSAGEDDNKRRLVHFKPTGGGKVLRDRFNMLMAEAESLFNSLRAWQRHGLKGALHHKDFDRQLRRSLDDSSYFARVHAREARKLEKEKKEKQELNSARKTRRAAAKEREEKERVEREESRRKAMERAEKERVEREKRLDEERRVAEEERERKESAMRESFYKTIQHMNGINVSSDSESSDDDEGPSAPVQDPARKWLRQPAVQTDSPGSASKGGRGIKGRLSTEARRKLRKAAKSSRPDSPDEECGGFVGDDGFGGDDDFGDDE